MKHLIITYLVLNLIIFNQCLYAQKELSSAEVVEENLSYYNQRNLEGFMSSFSDSIVLFSFGNELPVAKGSEAIKALYSELFENSPNLHSTILHRAVIGNKIIDHESIVGRKGKMEAIEIVMIYEVHNQKIAKMTVIR